MTKIAFQQWQQLIAIMLFALSLGMSPAHAASFNINTASAEEIQKNLDGIGPVKAKAIVDYRRKNGKFSSTDDLLKVDGIGPGTVTKNLSTLGLKRGKVSLKSSSSAKAKTKAKAKSASTSAKSKTSSAKDKLKSKTSSSSSKTKVSAKTKAEAKAKAKSKSAAAKAKAKSKAASKTNVQK